MSALSDDMKAELDQLPPHWRVHGKIQSWLGRVRELEALADLADLQQAEHRATEPEPRVPVVVAGEGA